LSGRPLPVLEDRRRTISRTDDRRLTFGGLGVSAGLLGLAILTLLLPEATRRGLWLPLHLALAGAAATAVASVLPFFTAALAVARPAGRPTRILAIGGVAGGALVVSGGVTAGASALAAGGGVVYLVGLVAVSVAAFAPLRGALGPRRILVTRAYAAAIGCVAAGAALSTAFLAGFGPVVERWGALKPAHAWLNVVGFLSLVVAATLIHLAPTVVGGRMQARTSARVAVVGLGAGAPLVATGLGLVLDPVVRAGAVLTVVGALALVVHGLVVERARGRWTTDPGWHRLTSWSLLLAPVWLLIGVAIVGGRSLVMGASPAAWDIGIIAPALVIGWVAQVLVGAWSHLLPAIGPGDPVAHARQRTILGRAATTRVVALNAGAVLATAGALTATGTLVTGGLLLSAASLASALLAFATAARIGVAATLSSRGLDDDRGSGRN
jgi:nitrite reductase (NO-forming)